MPDAKTFCCWRFPGQLQKKNRALLFAHHVLSSNVGLSGRCRVDRQKLWRHHVSEDVRYKQVVYAYNVKFFEQSRVVHQRLHLVCERSLASRNHKIIIYNIVLSYCLSYLSDITVSQKPEMHAQLLRYSFHASLKPWNLDRAAPVMSIKDCTVTTMFKEEHAVVALHNNRLCRTTFDVAQKTMVHICQNYRIVIPIAAKRQGQLIAVWIINFTQSAI